MKTTNLRLPITVMGVALGYVALLFLPRALSVKARTSDASITGLTLARGEPGILTVTRDAVDPPPGDYRVNWAEADEEFPSWVALLFLSRALSVEARTSDASITGLTLARGEPGTLTASWHAADPPPGDYRVNWAKADEEFPSWQDGNGNAFPTSTAYTVSNLEPGVEYKVRVRARYFDGNGNRVRSGPWSVVVRLAVAAQTDAPLQDSDEEARRQPNSWEELLRQETVGPAVTNAGTGGFTGVGGVNHVDGANSDVSAALPRTGRLAPNTTTCRI